MKKYGREWPANTPDLAIEMTCIRTGQSPHPAVYHYEQMRRIIWPHLDSHRWHVLCTNEIFKNKVTVLMGPGSSGKTHEAAWSRLAEYWVFADEICVLVSSTDLRGLELRVWGEIKSLFQQGKDRFPWLPGNLIDSRHCISTDAIDEEKARDLRKGIIGIPCIQNGKFVGLGKYAGIKQKKMRLVADEAQFMGASFLSAFANLDKNIDFRAIVLGNPNDLLDPLGKAAEPLEGWESYMDVDKTTVWKTRFMDGCCVNLIGTDSPNNDYPENEPPRFPYLISRQKIKSTLSFFDENSIEYRSQCVGNMRVASYERRVISKQICEKFHAFDEPVWGDGNRVKIMALDAAYGGDRCVGGYAEFGRDPNGKNIIYLHPPEIVPITVSNNLLPEDSIAIWCREFAERNGISPSNFFHDSTGRGSLGTALAREWSSQCVPIEFGGPATKRPVSLDHFTIDPKTKSKRLLRCDEHYVKFVTELWFSCRYAIEAGQIRGLTQDVMEEGCMREWKPVNGFKKCLESKEDMKLRVGRSPDLFDWFSIIVEGARRRGFIISKLAVSDSAAMKDGSWLNEIGRKVAEMNRKKQLAYD